MRKKKFPLFQRFLSALGTCLFFLSASSSILGLNDLKNEGQFQWADGTNITIKRKWFGIQPDNHNNEDCVEIRKWGLWNDNHCLQRYGFICETGLSNDEK